MRESGDEFGALAGRQRRGWGGGQDKIPIQVHDQGIRWRGEGGSRFGRGSQDVRTGFLDQFAGQSCVHDGDVETAPFVDPDTVSEGFGSGGEHGGMVADEDDSTHGV